jgi:hypothetical protein
MSWKQKGKVEIWAMFGTKIKLEVSGQGKKVKLEEDLKGGAVSAAMGMVIGEWYVDPKDLPKKVRMRCVAYSGGGGGCQFQFIDRNDESKFYGQFIGQLGGYSIVGLDAKVKLKIG